MERMEYGSGLEQLPELLLPWYQENCRDLPWRKDRDPYHIWVSEIMLQQTRVEAVKGYYERFLNVFPDIASLAEADDELLNKLWEGLGYYSRVRNLKKAAIAVMQQHGGVFPRSYDLVRKLPGIGPYTAGAVCSIAFDQPTPAVDGNVLRVFARLTDDDTPIDLPAFKEFVTTALGAVYPPQAGAFTQAVMELGATVCGPNRKPDCINCPCNGICKGFQKGTADTLPVKLPKRQRREEDITVFILSCDGDYALEMPDEMEVFGVVEPNKYKQGIAKERYGLSDAQLFDSLEAFLRVRPQCDLIINATMDQLHYRTSIDILKSGYDMMLEKPIVNNVEELLEIERVAKQNNCKVFVCHVLRYTPYYRAIKNVINNGEIGEIMTIEMNEHICTPHYLTSFDRGKWNSEDVCGSGLLLAKSCHDLDLMCWLNNASVPYKVVSFGSRSQFIKEKMPKGATEFCFDCPYERECQYSALRQYMDLKAMPFLVWDSFNKPYEEITDEEKIEFLKKDNYGRCAYIAGGDLLDRQSVAVTFENGSCCTFMLVGGALKAERDIHIVGTLGEIEGKLSEEKFLLRKYDKDAFDGVVQVIDLKAGTFSTTYMNGHNGGDFAIMHDVIGYLNGVESPSITKLDDSIYGHLCVFAAEKARKEDVAIKLNDIKDGK